MSKKYNIKNVANSYEFDVLYEEKIYKYLCCKMSNKKVVKKMDNDIKFTTYHQWENYIQNKYKHLSEFELIEFSHFLNQKIRNLKPGYEYWKIIVPVIITLIIEELFSALIDISQIKINTVFELFIELIIIIFVTIISLQIFIKTTKPIWDVTDKIDFYSDYKEIIDKMIENYNKDINNNP